MKKNKKFKTFLYLVLLFFFVLAFQTIAYSAINGTMTLSGDAYARAEADVRITNFRLANLTYATSHYEEFGKNHIVTEVDLNNSSSQITYYLEITNYGSVDIGIYDITGLPSDVNYSIKNYNLHDKICDDTGKCNGFIKKTYEITLTTTSVYSGQVQLNFDFRTYHKVTYNGITNNNYPIEVIDGGNLSITFKENLNRVQATANENELAFYSSISNGQTITINNITNDIELKIKPKVAKLMNGDINVVGSEVCIKDECFYIVSNDGTKVTMLSKYNLHAGGDYSSQGYNNYETAATNKQNSTMIGYIESNESYKGVIQFAGTNYWSSTVNSYPSYVYNENSYLYSYIEKYKTYLSGLGAPPIDARLITYEELESLGCSGSSKSCDSAPSWIYETSYWTGTANDSEYLWYVRTNKMFDIRIYNFSCYFGVRPVIELPVEEIKLIVSVKDGNGTDEGNIICIDEECFRTISNDTNSITMLSENNLYVGGTYDETSSKYTLYGSEATKKQNPEMIGYGKNPRKGTIEFSSSNYWSSTITSYPAYVYNSNSKLYSYVEEYKTYLSEKGVTINEARLITAEELEKLKCSRTNTNCTSAPEWLYKTTFWSGTAKDENRIWHVNSDGTFHSSYSEHNELAGLRPVIKIPKWMIAKTISFTLDGKIYYAKEGMTWNEWGESKYNTFTKWGTPLTFYSTYINCPVGDSYYVCNSNSVSDKVKPTDIIIAGHTYYMKSKSPE